MMGGGEGGAALVLISRDAVPRLEETLRSGYYARYGMADRDGLIHICAFAPGATYIPTGDGQRALDRVSARLRIDRFSLRRISRLPRCRLR